MPITFPTMEVTGQTVILLPAASEESWWLLCSHPRHRHTLTARPLPRVTGSHRRIPSPLPPRSQTRSELLQEPPFLRDFKKGPSLCHMGFNSHQSPRRTAVVWMSMELINHLINLHRQPASVSLLSPKPETLHRPQRERFCGRCEDMNLSPVCHSVA